MNSIEVKRNTLLKAIERLETLRWQMTQTTETEKWRMVDNPYVYGLVMAINELQGLLYEVEHERDDEE